MQSEKVHRGCPAKKDSTRAQRRGKTQAEWTACGDPRCVKGRFRPKKNIRAFLTKEAIGYQEFAEDVFDIRNSNSASRVARLRNGGEYMDDETLVKICGTYGLRLVFALDYPEVDVHAGISFAGGINHREQAACQFLPKRDGIRAGACETQTGTRRPVPRRRWAKVLLGRWKAGPFPLPFVEKNLQNCSSLFSYRTNM